MKSLKGKKACFASESASEIQTKESQFRTKNLNENMKNKQKTNKKQT